MLGGGLVHDIFDVLQQCLAAAHLRRKGSGVIRERDASTS